VGSTQQHIQHERRGRVSRRQHVREHMLMLMHMQMQMFRPRSSMPPPAQAFHLRCTAEGAP
jgi:hypothetical protein